MKTLVILALGFAALAASAQTSRERIGAGGGGGGGGAVDPRTGLPIGYTPPPCDQLSGDVRSVKNNLLLLDVERFQDGHQALVRVAVTNQPNLNRLLLRQ